MSLPTIEPNLIDQVIGYFDPEAALNRHRARTMLALSGGGQSGGYLGAKRNRRQSSAWKPGEYSADRDINPDLPTLRGRSRDLYRNNSLAIGAINTKVTNVVGTGLKLRARLDYEYLGMSPEQADAWERNAEREWRLWSESQHCDAEKTCNFAGIQTLVFLQTLMNGDVFIITPSNPEPHPYSLSLQVIEADRVCNEHNKADTATMSAGVEKSDTGAPIAYYVMKQHPGDIRVTNREWVKYEAFGSSGRRNVIHLYKKLRPGQSRGVPDLAAVIEPLQQLGKYTEAELMAAVVSGMFTVFVKTPTGAGLAPMEPTEEVGGATSDKDYKMGVGAMVNLMPGEDVTFADPNRPNTAYDPFVNSILRQIGVGLDLPFELLIKHFTASYSASRAALLEAWKFFNQQRQWLSQMFCQPVYELWLTEAVLLGRIAAPGFLNGDPAIRKAYCGAEWIGPARGQVDEKKEVEAAILRVNAGFSTRAEETAMMTGGDWEMKHKQSVKESQLRKEAGLEMDLNQVNNAPNNGQQDDTDDENDDNEDD